MLVQFLVILIVIWVRMCVCENIYGKKGLRLSPDIQ
jgi:hypothetical protein